MKTLKAKDVKWFAQYEIMSKLGATLLLWNFIDLVSEDPKEITGLCVEPGPDPTI